MQNVQLWRRKRIFRVTVLTGLALSGLAVGSMAFGAAAKPKMQVLPSAKGLKYSQTVQVKAQNLPKGSGTIALTICGLHNAKGAKIAKPAANDCAGADDLGAGLVKLQENKNGTFDQKYKLPASGQKFGKNARFCDAKHHCALVVADANPDKPAYHVDTEITFTDQKPPATKPKPTTKPTTKPKPVPAKPKPTTTTTTQPDFSFTVGGSANAGDAGGSSSGGATVTVNVPDAAAPPTAPPTGTVPAPVGDALTDACRQVADAVKQGGGDASALTIACSTLVNGGSGAQLGLLLQSPSFACTTAASATQGNEQLADACSQLATVLEPCSSELGTALSPVLGLLP